MLATALLAAVACAGFVVLSASSTHRAAAATVQPRAITGAVDLSLSVGGVVGEGGLGGPGTIEINSFQWGITKPATSSGAGTGKVKFNEFTIKKVADRTSPGFFKNCAQGTHYHNVTLAIRKQGGAPSDIFTLNFGNVVVAQVSWAGDATVTGQGLEESITMVPQTATVTYTPVKPG